MLKLETQKNWHKWTSEEKKKQASCVLSVEPCPRCLFLFHENAALCVSSSDSFHDLHCPHSHWPLDFQIILRIPVLRTFWASVVYTSTMACVPIPKTPPKIQIHLIVTSPLQILIFCIDSLFVILTEIPKKRVFVVVVIVVVRLFSFLYFNGRETCISTPSLGVYNSGLGCPPLACHLAETNDEMHAVETSYSEPRSREKLRAA